MSLYKNIVSWPGVVAAGAASLILSATDAVKSAFSLSTTEKLSYLVRALVLSAAMLSVAVREAGWNAIFIKEMVCRFFIFNSDTYHPPSEAFLSGLSHFSKIFQALSVSLFVIAQVPNFWAGTKISNWRQHFDYTHAQENSEADEFAALSWRQKILFYFLGCCGIANLAVGILRNQVGSAAQFEKEWSVPSETAKNASIAITIFLGLVSLLVRMPGYLRRCYQFSSTVMTRFHDMLAQVRNVKSIVNLSFVIIASVSTAISMADYLSRFIERQDKSVDAYIPALVFCVIASFAFAVFTAGASMIKKNLVQQMRARWFMTLLFLLNGCVWLLLNINQLVARSEEWIFHPHNITQAHSDHFTDLCRAQFENRRGTLAQRVLILIVVTLLAFPLTISMMAYLLDLLCGDLKKTPAPEEEEEGSWPLLRGRNKLFDQSSPQLKSSTQLTLNAQNVEKHNSYYGTADASRSPQLLGL